MPIPFLLIGAALAGGALVKAAKTTFRDESARRGYCTWCGSNCRHTFFEDGLSWKKTGPIAILTGGIGTAVAGVVSRNIYKCTSCGKRTLPCRMPGCDAMARSNDVYDEEFCGRCVDGNNSSAERAHREREEERNAKLVEVLKQHEAQLRAYEAEHARLMAERRQDSERIRGLLRLIEEERTNIGRYRTMLVAVPT